MTDPARGSAQPSRTGTWRVHPLVVSDPEALLAGGLALLDSLADDPIPTVRWYRAARPALVLGRGQRPDAVPAVDGPGARTPVVARFSGGGAVLWDDSLLACDVALPARHPWLDGALGDVFLQVGGAWARGLAALGVPEPTVHRGAAEARRRGSARERLLAAVCFATRGRGEVLVGGRKLVGLAQRRRRAGALVQCGVLRRWEPGPLLAALGADPDDPEIAGAAVGLDELVHPPPDDHDIITAVTTALTRTKDQP